MKGMKYLKKIRKKIPTFECVKGCHECCGIVPFSKLEWDKIKDKREATTINCPYIEESGCDIYNDRPIMCRLFGTVEKMPCPHGCKPKKTLTIIQEKNIMNEYMKLF